MTRVRPLLRSVALAATPLVLALAFTTLVLVAVRADPLAAYRAMWHGAFGSLSKFADVLLVWAPLVLCAAGLLFTFTAGLWNIGIEGQMVFGAIAATWAARTLDWPAAALIPALMLAGGIGGALWALLAGALRIYGKVHEIFAGLGLNFVAIAFTNFLIFGPWRQPGMATMSGTEPFRKSAWLPNFGGLSLGPVELALAVGALVFATLALRGTMWGLRLKAIGKNARAAFVLGVETERNMLGAFLIGGALAGVAGAVQATGLFHRLIPSISSGYGYLAILVCLLAGNRGLWVAPVALFFAAAVKGSLQLPMQMQLDSALGGILQGVLVLMVLLVHGVRSRRANAAGS
jgi:simple sugar transport system permease protein